MLNTVFVCLFISSMGLASYYSLRTNKATQTKDDFSPSGICLNCTTNPSETCSCKTKSQKDKTRLGNL